MSAPLSQNLDWELANSQWASALNPIIANPIATPEIIKNVPLKMGINVVNHSLGRVMQGFFIIDIQGPATVYRSSPFNATTLILTSNSAVTLSLGVF